MLSIIISTLNEEEGIAKTICMIPEEIRKTSEVIVVDVSDDFTPIIAQALGVTVLKEVRKGKGWQMRQAVKQSKGDILIFMDGDGTDPGQYIPKLLKKLEKANLVLGCRNRGKLKIKNPKMDQIIQFYGSKIAGQYLSYMFNLDVADPLAGFRAIRLKDWEALDLESNGFEIETEMNIKAMQKNFIIKEVLIPNLKRCGGVQGSKFAKSPKMWVKIYKMISSYNKERKLKKT